MAALHSDAAPATTAFVAYVYNGKDLSSALEPMYTNTRNSFMQRSALVNK